MKHPDEAQVHDFVDGELASDERARIAAHLAECPSCRVVAEWALGLRERAVRQLGSAPADGGAPDPGPDQWPVIEARIRGEIIPLPARSTPPARAPMFSPLAAAAVVVLLVALSSAATYALMRSRGEPVAVATELEVDPPATAIAAAYAPVFAELEGILAQGRGRLQPETIATLEANLEILNAAMRDIHAALVADPANRGNLRSLEGIYQAKLGFLRQAATLPSGA